MNSLRKFKREAIKRQLSGSEMLDFLDECIAKGEVPIARVNTLSGDLPTIEQTAKQMRDLFEEAYND